MKGAFLSLAIILALGMPALHSQDADPAPAAAPTAPEPIPPVEKGTPLAMLKAMLLVGATHTPADMRSSTSSSITVTGSDGV